MRFTSSPRRAFGVFAVSAIGMSSAVLGVTGVAQATGPVALTTSTPLTIPAGVCTVDWVLNGGGGSAATGHTGGAGSHIVIHSHVVPGDSFTAAPSTLAGGAAGTGGGAGGSGVGLSLDSTLQVVAAGGGGAGTWNDGGDAENPGGNYGGTYTYDGGQPGTDIAGTGGSAGGDPTGFDGSDGVAHVGGAGGNSGAGGGGGGAFGGGGGASDGTDGTGGGGGSNLIPDGAEADVTAATGAAGITYEYQNCTADQIPAAPTDVTAEGGDGKLTIDFTPNWDSGASPNSWQYQIGAGSWTDFDPDYTDWGPLELVVDGLTNGTPYTVHVRALSSDGVPGPAASVTKTPYKPIGAPTNVAYTVSGSVVTITWDAPATTGTFALAGYQAGLGYSNGQSGGLAFECDTELTVHVCAAPAPPGPDYSFGVSAVDTEGNLGTPSDMVTVGKIAAPASVPASDGKLTVPSGSGASGDVVKGEQVHLHGTGYLPNSLVSVLIYSTPQVLTTVMTDGSGSFDVMVTVPIGLPSGNHTLVAAGVDPAGHTRYMTLPVTVTGGKAELAYTGASIVGPGVAGLATLVVGSGLLLLSRRRRTE